MSDLYASLIAALIVLAVWACFAAPVALVAHLRMRRVEAELGAPALPPYERPLLLQAVASIAWPVASVVALIAWIKRPWARLGRNVTLIFLLQITGSVLSAVGAVIWNGGRSPGSPAEELLPLVILASVNLAAGVLIATPLLWVWAGRRADRLCLPPPKGPPPGLWRFALYAGCLLFSPLGVILAVMFTAPENARVGANGLRCSVIHVACLAIAVCVAVPFLVRLVFLSLP